ncbi:MAG: hypothetical protein HZC47_00920 [Methanobacterium sp.]|uniref:hypothetical protein n=1 Tax=Methanobacterium sp. TaxID=2164 RepID=UPI003D653050|nr:hypothetical protein [Methanobacterium sp.]
MRDTEVVFNVKAEDPEDFLRQVIVFMERITDENYEVIQLGTYNRTDEAEPAMTEFMDNFAEFLKKNIPNKEVDHMALGLSIQAFVFMYNINKRHLHQLGVDLGDALEGFIHNAVRSVRE